MNYTYANNEEGYKCRINDFKALIESVVETKVNLKDNKEVADKLYKECDSINNVMSLSNWYFTPYWRKKWKDVRTKYYSYYWGQLN